jgi:protein ImuB
MTLAQARALCTGLEHEEHDPAADANALHALARWMMRFTPTLQCAPSGLFLDVTGTQRLFGSLQNLLEKIHRALASLKIRARLAIAPAPGAAWALTYADRPLPIVTDPRDLPDALSPLPPLALRLADDALALLHHLGLETVGHILRLPRDMLPARFGDELLRRIDQATARLPDPLNPLPWHEPIQASIDFDGVVDSLETLWQAFGQLIEQVIARLTRLGAGARQLTVTFIRPHAPPIERKIDLSAPSKNAANLFNLIRCTMETLGEATKRRRHEATKGKTDHRFTLRRSVAPSLRRSEPTGFTALRLAVPLLERLTEDQIHLLDQEEHASQTDLARLIERLKIRLGDQALLAIEPVESHIPERAYKTITPSPHPPITPSLPEPLRPLHLLPTPREIAVLVRPSHDRDGAPIAFTLDGRTRPITHAVGPERIAGQWWQSHHKTRDYFDVEDEDGRRWWVFRVFQTSRWFVHGVFK